MSKWRISLSLRWLGLHLHQNSGFPPWLYRGMLGKVQEASKSSGMLALVELDTCPFFYVTFRWVKPDQKSPSMLYQGVLFLLSHRYDFGEFLRILDADTAATEASEKHQEGWCCIVVLRFLTWRRLHLHVRICPGSLPFEQFDFVWFNV